MRVRGLLERRAGVSRCLPLIPETSNLEPTTGAYPAVKGFISYTHTDHKLCGELQSHLALGKDHGGADFWADKRITAGAQWSTAIEQAIDEAEIFLLLVTAKFFGSAYIMNIELPRILARAA